MDNPKPIIVTSALPYANGPIHLGHLVEYIQTDVYVRALRLMGEDVVYCCADDTHGTPIEVNAAKLGVTPEALVEKVWHEHRKDFAEFQIRFDNFYSTNSPENKECADLIYSRLRDNGDIYTKEVDLTHCARCNRFLPDRFVKGTCPRCGAPDQYGDNCERCNATYNPTDLVSPSCVICGTPPGHRTSRHFFFKLANYADRLRAWLTGNENLQPEIRNYILHWVDEGLKDWDISRDAPYFGFPILGETDKYYYVWLDAPIGYIASCRNLCLRTGRDWESYWVGDRARVIHFIGKDIIYFHFLFWPAMLMGAGFNVPENIHVHGFLTVNGEKMSKSRGTYLTARDYLEKLDPAFLRYYYAANLSPKLADIDLDLEDFRKKVNAELIGNFANFANRTLTFLQKNFDGRTAEGDPGEPDLQKDVLERVERVKAAYRKTDFRLAVREILEIGDLGNRYFQAKAPWALLKTDRAEAHRVVSFTVNLVRILGILFKPVVPVLCTELERQLGLPHQVFADARFDLLGHEIGSPAPLIPRLESVELVKADPFAAVDLRVGKIVEVGSHPKADKLVVMQVDLGTGKRQLCAGIRTFYTDGELLGKHIVVVANLKPAKLRGMESQGMLLAASSETALGVLTTEALPGTPVRPKGVPFDGTPQIEITDFQKVTLRSEGGKPLYGDLLLLAGDAPVVVDRGVDGGIK
ncbi:MAG: methionine--tRNA ligase [Acidobacteria bacterium]|nr:methionine--tRNA ligase [Acidobacteriota bacterium]